MCRERVHLAPGRGKGGMQMKLSELLEGVSYTECHAQLSAEICDVTADSRNVQPGALGVAIVGFETDGHRYIASALEKGASVIVCEKAPEQDCAWIRVENSRLAMALLAANYFGRPGDRMQLIGVTGTNGKTTVTTLIRDILGDVTGEKIGLIGTNGNRIGDLELPAERTTPDARELQALLARMVEAGCRYVVMEVSSHSLALDRVAGLHFAVAAFTNLTQDHLDFHKDMDNYLAAKCRLFGMCDTAVVNADDPASRQIIRAAGSSRVITYGVQQEKSELKAQRVRLGSDRVAFEAYFGLDRVPVMLGIPGMVSVYNALTTIGCCLALGLDITDITVSMTGCKGVKGRMEVVPTGRDFTILIDYAHTPDALENVIRTVKSFARGRTIVLFGCGGDRDRGKRPKMGAIACKLADVVIVTSDNPRTEQPEAIMEEILAGTKGRETPVLAIPDRIEAIRCGMEMAQAGDVLILAGKGHETYQIVGREKHHMDEREIVADILKNLE